MEKKEQSTPEALKKNAGDEHMTGDEAKEPKTAKEKSPPEQKQDTAPATPEGVSEKPVDEPEKTDAGAEKPDAKPVKPDTASEKPVDEPEKADAGAEKPDAKPVKPDTASKKPVDEPEKADAGAEKPDAKPVKPDTASKKPVDEPEKADAGAEKPDAKPVKPDTASEKPVDEPEKADAGAEKPDAEGPSAEKKQETEEPSSDQPSVEASAGQKDTDKDQKTDQESEPEDSDALLNKYNAMGREALVTTIEELVTSEDVNHIRKHIGFIKAAYRKLLRDENMASYEQRLGKETHEEGEEVVSDPLTDRFDAAFSIYKEKKAAFDKALELEMQANLKAKEEILEALRQLIDSEEELKKTYDQFHALQDRWRAAGPVPRGAKGTLWNNYHFLVEKFFDKVNINKELKDLDLKKNLEAKTDLCEKAEELLLETSIIRSFQQLQKLHEAWKEIGPVPQDKKDEIWERFKAATDKLNKRRQEHYESLREEQNKNYAAKLVLCEKAEELITLVPVTPRQWQQKTNEINELFKVWKTIGFAPKKVNNEIWNRFRTSLDTFFTNKKEFFRKYKDQQKENYNQKLNLCLQAEALKESDDWRATTEALINLQQEWKKIGPVPAKFSDKIWKRFRQACDTFFSRKSEHFSNIGEKQEENLQKKLNLIEEIQNHSYSNDNKENLNILKDFQRKWMDIGHVPIKQKDKVQTAFRKAIDNQFEVLNISKKAKTTLSFRSKIENLKNAPNAGNIIYKERNILTNKIKNLEGDIQVLENNIGFFASSKKADILKAEFEEKIERAKSEISILREKMKILSDA